MRVETKGGGYSLKAYAGTTGVLLASNAQDALRGGLLGFAIERENLDGPKRGFKKWLKNLLHFPQVPHQAGEPVDSNLAPIQKFRWSDYTVYPGQKYAYRVHPVYGTWNSLDVRAPLQVEVKTLGQGASHFVIFNRACAASQAFSREFKHVIAAMNAHKKKHGNLKTFKMPAEAYEWLSRGALETITNFIGQANGPEWALDVVIYEYELPAIHAAVAAADRKGARIRVIYHAKKGDAQTAGNEHTLKHPALRNAKIIPRKTSRIMHDKFIVLSRVSGNTKIAQAVLCGTTNFTENGVYRQANAIHVASDPAVADAYLRMADALEEMAESPGKTKKWIDQNNAITAGVNLAAPVFAGFSPRSGLADIDAFVRIIGAAQRDVLFCTAFDLHEKILNAVLGAPNDPILRYGMQNTKSAITGFKADRTADFQTAALLDKGLEGWLKESLVGQAGRILIHTKLIVTDFTSRAPRVICGSHNLSKAASDGNDENYLVIQCRPDETNVADVYGCELMRIFDHYRFRAYARGDDKNEKGKRAASAPAALKETDVWSVGEYTPGSLPFHDRTRFGIAP
jgi:hypothetical protein